VCQQWFSEIGLVLDVVGFLIIAVEWHHEFVADREKRLRQLSDAYERAAAEAQGEPVGDRNEDKMMWREFQKFYMSEWRWRGRVFYTGVSLVVRGFVGQFVGGLPGGIPLLGVRAC
jgi:hypothetical protein